MENELAISIASARASNTANSKILVKLLNYFYAASM